MLIETRIPYKYIFRKIELDLFRVLIFSIAFHVILIFFASYLPQIPFQLPTILGTSISLLLAFNVNQSYDRWWEARKVWGAIVNDSRSFTIQLKGFINQDALEFDKKSSSLLYKMVYRQIAWCYCLGQSLRGNDPLIADVTNNLSPEDVQFIKEQNNKPFALLMLHMEDLKDLYEANAVNSFQQIQINDTITRLCDSMGKAERINSTVFPVTYRVFIHFFIYLFLIILSLALVETIGWFEIPILTLIASTFFLIEKTARYMQDPFRNKPTDTAVTAIARTIDINLKQILHQPNVPKPLQPEGFYLM